MKTIKTYLPLFSGFYGTIFEPSGEDDELRDVNYEREQKGLKPVEYDDLKFDYDYYYQRVSKDVTTIIQNKLNDVFTNPIEFEFEELRRPKEYNFVSDSINIKAKVSVKLLSEIEDYLTSNEGEFDQHLKDNYTSRDGFISSFSNESEVWLNKYWNEMEENGHILGAILDFVLVNEEITDYDIYNELECSSVSADNYCELIGEE